MMFSNPFIIKNLSFIKGVLTPFVIFIAVTVGSVEASQPAIRNMRITSLNKSKKVLTQLTAVATAIPKVYDGTTKANITVVTNNIKPLDNVTVVATAVFEDKNASPGKRVFITYKIEGNDIANYLAPVNDTLYNGVITKKQTSIGLKSITTDRQYNGTDIVEFIPTDLTDTIRGDIVTCEYHANFSSKNVSSGNVGQWPITFTFVLKGEDANNYLEPAIAPMLGSISPRQLYADATIPTLIKPYDGTTKTDVIAGPLSNLVDGEEGLIHLNAEANFDNAMVGPYKTVTVTYWLTGNELGNYYAPIPRPYDNAEIIKPQPYVKGTQFIPNKTYDGTTTRTISFKGTLSKIEDVDNGYVDFTANGTYSEKNQGVRAITIKYTLFGDSAYKYSAPKDSVYKFGIITRKGVSISIPAYDNRKPYNGNADVNNVVPGDFAKNDICTIDIGKVTVKVLSASYDDQNVHVGKMITIKYYLDGAEAANYSFKTGFDTYTSTDGEIVPKRLTISPPSITNNPRVYNGTKLASANIGVLSLVEPPDFATISPVCLEVTYNNKNSGNNKNITVKYGLQGNDKGNYLPPVDYVYPYGNITPKPLSISEYNLTKEKVYDGSTSAVIKDIKLNDVEPVDSADLKVKATAAYETPNAGSGKNIFVKYILVNDSGNYTLSADHTEPDGIITKQGISISDPLINPTKVYDGTTTADVKPGTLTGLFDIVTVKAEANYPDINVGDNKPITIHYVLEAIDSKILDNYSSLPDSIYPSGSIVAKQLKIESQNLIVKKEYDGNTSATISNVVLKGIVNNETQDIQVSAIANYDDPSARIGKTITIKYALLNNEPHFNYLVPTDSIVTIGKITPIQLTATSDYNVSKVYDGTDTLHITLKGFLKVLPKDMKDVEVSPEAHYTSVNVGPGKRINIKYNIKGNAATNYLAPVSFYETRGAITKKQLYINKIDLTTSKVYDGNTFAQIGELSFGGIVNNEPQNIDVTAIASYADANASENKKITIAYSIQNDKYGNYKVPGDSIYLQGIIAPKVLIRTLPTLVSRTKEYDGTTTATATPGIFTNITAAELGTASLNAVANYSDENAGINKTISITYTLKGSLSSNFKAPSDTVIYDRQGVITPIKLTIDKPQVVTIKMYNGTTEAVITKLGTLNGIIARDKGSVSVKATANYDSPEPGDDKTITVIYTLVGGSVINNYVIPDKVTMNGEIADKVRLQPLSVESSGCEGSVLHLVYNAATGTPTKYRILYGSKAFAAGFDDTGYIDMPVAGKNGVISIPVSEDASFGTYNATIQMKNIFDVESDTYPFEFVIDVSTRFITRVADDMLLFNAKANVIKEYQWYKNGEIVPGATNAFLFDPYGIEGVYSVKMVTNDGTTLHSCETVQKKQDSSTQRKSIIAFPNPVLIPQQCIIKIVGFTDDELANSHLYIHTPYGVEIYNSSEVNPVTMMGLPPVAGVYIGHLVTGNKKEYIFKIIVVK